LSSVDDATASPPSSALRWHKYQAFYSAIFKQCCTSYSDKLSFLNITGKLRDYYINEVSMKKEVLKIENIPAILWGEKSNKVYIYVHGKLSSKEEALGFAEKAIRKGYQVLSFDLPEHGERTKENYPCTAWNGVHDLGIIESYVRQGWSDI